MKIELLVTLERDKQRREEAEKKAQPVWRVYLRKWIRTSAGYGQYEEEGIDDYLPDLTEPAVSYAEAQRLEERLKVLGHLRYIPVSIVCSHPDVEERPLGREE